MTTITRGLPLGQAGVPGRRVGERSRALLSFGEPIGSGVEDSQLRGLPATLDTTLQTAERIDSGNSRARGLTTPGMLTRRTRTPPTSKPRPRTDQGRTSSCPATRTASQLCRRGSGAYTSLPACASAKSGQIGRKDNKMSLAVGL